MTNDVKKVDLNWHEMKNFNHVDAKPTWIQSSSFKTYKPEARMLSHVLRYDYAVAALLESRMEKNQGYPLTKEQKEKIDKILKKERKNFIGWQIVGWVGLATNFAVFVPLLVQSIQQPQLYQNLALIWLGLITQIVFLIYAIGIRSMPILILSCLLIPLMIVVLILVYENLKMYPHPEQC